MMRFAAFLSACLLWLGLTSASAQVQIQFQTPGASVAEGVGLTTVALALSGLPGPQGASVEYMVTSGTATGGGIDYQLLGSGKITFAPGSTEGWVQQERLTAVDPSVGKGFGGYVAADGDLMAVGAPFDEVSGLSNAGSAYVYERVGDAWTFRGRIIAPNAASGDYFGTHLAVNGDLIAVGARYADRAGADSGSVYLFQLKETSIVLVAEITPSDRAPGDQFGSGIGLTPSTMVVGAWGSAGGYAYVFERDADQVWSQVRKLTATDSRSGDLFGVDVAIEGDTAIIGATKADSVAPGTGAAYVFERDAGGSGNWGQVQKLAPVGGQSGDNFGVRVSLSGDYLAVGAEASGPGSVYLYKRTSGAWVQQARIIPSDGADSDRFGWYLSLRNDRLVVGSVGHNSEAGVAYLYQRNDDNTWPEIARIAPDVPHIGDMFGSGVAFAGNTLIAGARGADAPAMGDSGAAYTFDLQPADRISLAIVDDHVHEMDESLQINLSSAVGMELGPQSVHTVTIVDNDEGELPQVSFSPVAPETVSESATSVTIPIRLIGNATGAPVSIDYAVTGGTATGEGIDYTLLGSGTLQLNDSSATGWTLRKKPAPADPALDQWFGDFVALDGDTAVITALNDSTAAYQAGAAYVFTRDGNDWKQQAKLVPADGQYQEWFGMHLRLDGNTLAVGARYDDVVGADSGAVYVYERTGTQWNQVKKLWPANGQADDQFGSGIALSGDYLVAGCWRTPDKPGLTYIYDRHTSGKNAWGLIKTLQASDATAGDRFGVDVCVDRETVIVGATTANGRTRNTGAVYVYECNAGGVDNWGQVQKLTASDGATGDNFGVRVAVCGDVLAVGAEQSGAGAAGAGAVYLYKRVGGAWSEWTKIVSNDGKVDDWFGWYLSLTENWLAVGAVRNDGAGENSGAVYLYQRNGNTWQQLKKLTAPDAASGDFFGSGVALCGGTVLAGARYKNSGNGASYIFEMQPENAVGLSINNDRVYEDNETIQIALGNPVNATLVDPSTHTMTIVDDDEPPSVTLTMQGLSVSAKDRKAILHIKLAGSPTQQNARVKYSTVDGTAHAGRDYQGSSGYLTLSQALRRQDLEVRLESGLTSGSDASTQTTRTFQLRLSDERNATLGIAACSVAITDLATSGSPTQTAASHWELFK